MAKTLEDMLISKGDLDRIYKGSAELYLWRALSKKNNDSGNPLYPTFEGSIRKRKGGIKEKIGPDIETKYEDGDTYVYPAIGRGTSLFDREGAFGFDRWVYFCIPKGTYIPEGLIITRDAKKCTL